MKVHAASEAIEVLLGAQLLVRDAAEAKDRLHDALERGLPIRLHTGRLERIDTAGLQLLLAFVREAKARGRPVKWCGDTAILAKAFECLGLREAFDAS